MDPFVELKLFDPARNETEVQQSTHLVNEVNPKWGEKVWKRVVEIRGSRVPDVRRTTQCACSCPPLQRVTLSRLYCGRHGCMKSLCHRCLLDMLDDSSPSQKQQHVLLVQGVFLVQPSALPVLS